MKQTGNRCHGGTESAYQSVVVWPWIINILNSSWHEILISQEYCKIDDDSTKSTGARAHVCVCVVKIGKPVVNNIISTKRLFYTVNEKPFGSGEHYNINTERIAVAD